MNNDNKNLSNQIAARTGKMTPLAIQDQLEKWKRVHFPKLAALAKTQEQAERLYTVCMNTISRNPKILECTFESIANCVLQCFQLNLYPGPMQECAFVPFAGVCTFMPMYQGILKLCYNSGFIKSVRCKVVWDGELFTYQEGLNLVLDHIPDLALDHETTKRMAVYCIVKTRYDDVQVAVLTPKFIQGIKNRAPGARKPDSPWNSKIPEDVDAMWMKTALKQALKFIPKNAEMADILERDNIADGHLPGARIIDLNAGAGAPPMAPLDADEDSEPDPPKTIDHDTRQSVTIPVKEQAKMPNV